MKRRRRGARLEMTSLMDVMFLVLVFFVYCIFDMAVHHGVKVELPRASGELEPGERAVVTITADNKLQLNGRALELEAIVGELQALHETGAKIPVIIAGDREAQLGTGIELLARLKSAGIMQISFQVSGATSDQPAGPAAP